MGLQGWLLTLIATIPLIWLLAGLGWFKMPAARTSLIGLGVAGLIALLFYNMSAYHMLQATAEGGVLAFWPILWAIIGAIFTYHVGVQTGKIEQIKQTLAGISKDRRVQVLILAWAFSGFLEGAAGYGTAVAIPASILISLGFEPLFAAVICLIGNTAPTAFGAIGIPVITLAKVTDLNVMVVSKNVALQLTPLIILLPLVMVWLTARKEDGYHGLQRFKGVVGVTLVAGVSFALVHYVTATLIGPELPALLGGIASLVSIILWLRISERWQRKDDLAVMDTSVKIPLKESVIAWSPYLILLVLIIATSSLVPAIYQPMERIQSQYLIYNGTNGKPMVIHWLLTPGSLIVIAAITGGLIQGATLPQLAKIFFQTLKKLWATIVTVCAIVALAKIMGYSGMIDRIAQALSSLTGRFYPLIAPTIGALGTFVTGSDTSANVLFGQLQSQTALQLKLSPAWLAAANTAGATAGKMLSPQNIAIAATATGLLGKEGMILNKTFKICLVYTAILGVMVFFN